MLEEGTVILKEPKTLEEQLGILRERGLVVENDAFAISKLSEINYYRFSAYLLPFKDNNRKECCLQGVNFNRILQVYEFDRQIRRIMFSVIEHIEIVMRAKLAYFHAHKYGVDGYLNHQHFQDVKRHESFVSEFEQAIQRNKKTLFIKHHISNYSSHFPIWVAVEIFSLGMLSRFVANMQSVDQKALARMFATGADHLTSWLSCLAYLRNICAHYGRIYFQKFVVLPKLPKKCNLNTTGRLFDVLYVLQYFYTDEKRWHDDVIVAFEQIIKEYEEFIDFSHIGFPIDWKKMLMQKFVK